MTNPSSPEIVARLREDGRPPAKLPGVKYPFEQIKTYEEFRRERHRAADYIEFLLAQIDAAEAALRWADEVIYFYVDPAYAKAEHEELIEASAARYLARDAALSRAMTDPAPPDPARVAEAIPSQSSHLEDFHLHCAAGCEKAVGELNEGAWVCTRCGAAFIECDPEICP